VTQPPAPRIGYIPALDGIRGLLLPGVILLHFDLVFNSRPNMPAWLRHTTPFELNIEMFFVLSGALITSLLVAEHHRSGSVSLKQFYVRRSRRLGPALVAVLPVLVLAQLAWTGPSGKGPLGPHPWLSLVALALFFGNWVLFRVSDNGIGWLGPAWTLAIEEQFYLTWPMLLGLALRRRMSRQAVIGGFAGAAVVALALSTLIEHRYGGSATYYATFSQLPCLIAGCALGHELTTNPGGRLARLLSRPAIGTVGGLGVVVVSYELMHHTRLMFRGGYLGYAVVACLLVGHCFVVAREGTALTRILAWRPFRIMGEISYEAYLIHLLVIFALLDAAPGLGVYPAMAIDITIIAAVSLALHYLVGKPIRRLGWRSFFNGLRPVPAYRTGSRGRPVAVAGGLLAGTAAVVLVSGLIVASNQGDGLAPGRSAGPVPAVVGAPALVPRLGSSAEPATSSATPVKQPSAPPAGGLLSSAPTPTRGGVRIDRQPQLEAPTITSLSPPIASLLGGSRIAVHGTGFTPGTRLSVGGLRIPVQRLSSSALSFEAPAARLVDPGRDLRHLAVSIVVRTAGGASSSNALSLLTYI
jgi:peptidoglycan/LPS O-acetylase OafA/YrhL